MSYILEALKKSDRERQHGTVPDLHTVQAVTLREPRKRSLWSYLILVALLLNASLFAVWLLRPWQLARLNVSREPTTTEPIDLTPVESLQGASGVRSPAALEAPLLSKTIPPRVRAAEARPVTGPEPSVVASNLTSDDIFQKEERIQTEANDHRKSLSKPPATSESIAAVPAVNSDHIDLQNPPAQANADERQKVQNKRPAKSGVRAAAPTVNSDHMDLKNQPVQAMNDRQRNVPSKTAPTHDAQAWIEEPQKLTRHARENNRFPTQPQSRLHIQGVSEQRIPNLYQLPVSVRRKVPDMSFSVHSYSDKPSARIVRINGRMLQEGQEVVAGLRLEQITLDGVIFNCEGHRFRMNVY